MAQIAKRKAQSYCPMCHKITSGPDKGALLEPTTPGMEGHNGRPITYHGRPLSYDVCEDCRNKPHDKAQFHDVSEIKKGYEAKAEARNPESGFFKFIHGGRLK